MKTKKDKPRTNIVIVGTGQLKKQYAIPGRNDPCPCGSKLKFKKCCLVRIEKERDEKLSAARDKYQQKFTVPLPNNIKSEENSDIEPYFKGIKNEIN